MIFGRLPSARALITFAPEMVPRALDALFLAFAAVAELVGRGGLFDMERH
jgi:hypothetical protein